MSSSTSDTVASLSDPLGQILRTLTVIAMKAFITDVVNMVDVMLTTEEADARSGALDIDDQWRAARRAQFVLWKKHSRVLGFEAGIGVDSIERLSKILSRSMAAAADLNRGLPASPEKSNSVQQFAHRLWVCASADTVRSMKAPAWSRGTFPSALKMVHAEAIKCMPSTATPSEQQSALEEALAYAITHLHINFFPDAPKFGSSPSPYTWTRLDVVEKPTSRKFKIKIKAKVKETRHKYGLGLGLTITITIKNRLKLSLRLRAMRR